MPRVSIVYIFKVNGNSAWDGNARQPLSLILHEFLLSQIRFRTGEILADAGIRYMEV